MSKKLFRITVTWSSKSPVVYPPYLWRMRHPRRRHIGRNTHPDGHQKYSWPTHEAYILSSACPYTLFASSQSLLWGCSQPTLWLSLQCQAGYPTLLLLAAMLRFFKASCTVSLVTPTNFQVLTSVRDSPGCHCFQCCSHSHELITRNKFPVIVLHNGKLRCILPLH